MLFFARHPCRKKSLKKQATGGALLTTLPVHADDRLVGTLARHDFIIGNDFWNFSSLLQVNAVSYVLISQSVQTTDGNRALSEPCLSAMG